MDGLSNDNSREDLHGTYNAFFVVVDKPAQGDSTGRNGGSHFVASPADACSVSLCRQKRALTSTVSNILVEMTKHKELATNPTEHKRWKSFQDSW